MVRAHVKQTPEEKKETHKKKTPSKKKSAEPGSWPCKINGCNKVFAREADLKRHQRTTKTHSMPGFACPQCDATFTRTDALRRHQKSRHNGVVIEPQDPAKNKELADGEAGSSGSKSASSREGTPEIGNGDAPSTDNSPASAPSQPTSSGPPGPSSYYRQHTMQTSPYPPRPLPGVMMDPHYPPPPIGIPTSATRLHQAWPPPPPGAWGPGPDGAPMPPPPGLYGMPPPGYYHPSPYYRHPAGMMPPPMHPYPPMHPEYHPMPNGAHPYPPPPGAQPLPAASSPAESGSTSSQAGDVDMNDDATKTAPVIDPSLVRADAESKPESKPEGKPEGKPQTNGDAKKPAEPASRSAAEAAVVEALLQHQKAQAVASVAPPAPIITDSQAVASSLTENSPEHAEHRAGTQNQVIVEASQQHGYDAVQPQPSQPSELSFAESSMSDGDADGEADAEGDADADGPNLEEQTINLSNIEGHPHVVVTDGEPTINPAELLTQEALATPPEP